MACKLQNFTTLKITTKLHTITTYYKHAHLYNVLHNCEMYCKMFTALHILYNYKTPSAHILSSSIIAYIFCATTQLSKIPNRKQL